MRIDQEDADRPQVLEEPDCMHSIGWFDLEMTRQGRLKSVGAIFGKRKFKRSDLSGRAAAELAIEEIEQFLAPAHYIAGHNVIGFDEEHLRAIRSQSLLLRKPWLDTLVLSAIAFPKKPYHRLIKDYKLVKDAIGDPVRDCELAKAVLINTVSSFVNMDVRARGVIASLLQLGEKYAAMGRWLGEIAPLQSSANLKDEMETVLAGQVCPNAWSEMTATISPDVSWAFLIAWARVAGDGSSLPMWVLRQWPALLPRAGKLRGHPCEVTDCQFCKRCHDPARFLPRFGITAGFLPVPTTPSGDSLQQTIIEAIYRGDSSLAILPTGGGKSLCYQLPALARYEATGELTVIISPLQSLMKDQVDGVENRLSSRLAEAVSGMLSPVERQVAFERVSRGDTAMLYLSPEQLRNPSVQSLLRTRRVECWVYDEAHCVSKWGHDFRPDYLAVARFISELTPPSEMPQVCALLPPYLRKAKSIEQLLPYLYLKGVSTGDFTDALQALLGPDCPGLSASTVTRLVALWQEEHEQWSQRDLSDKQYAYIWADGIYFNIRLAEPQDSRVCMLVLIGATTDGTKELIAVEMGIRESEQSWTSMMVNLKHRGLLIDPKLAIADGALGFWSAMRKVWPTTREQRCWVHKSANVLDKMPKHLQPAAKDKLHQIWMAATRKEAEKAFDVFLETYEAKHEAAVACLRKDRDALLTFYDFPAQHWSHIRTTNPIESTFATVRLRHDKTKGNGSKKACLAMVFKLAEAAQRSWRKLNGHALISDLIKGVKFIDGEITKAA